MSPILQSVSCPSCSCLAGLDPERTGRSMICEECRAVFLCPEPIAELTRVEVAEGQRVRLAPDGTWAHVGNVDVGRVELTAKAIPQGPTATKPDDTREGRPEWAVGIKMAEIPSQAAPEQRARAAFVPGDSAQEPLSEPDEVMKTAFANLPWYESEELAREKLDSNGYTPGAREEHGGSIIQHFRGSMGSQEIFLNAGFGSDQRLQSITCDILVDPRVQRDLFQAMVTSLDEKYGEESFKEQETDAWSASWLVHGGTSMEWSVSAQEQMQNGRHLVSVYYIAPRLHQQAAQDVSRDS